MEDNICACYYCLEEFTYDDIEHFLSGGNRYEDALCPYCQVDAVIPLSEYETREELELISQDMFGIH